MSAQLTRLLFYSAAVSALLVAEPSGVLAQADGGFITAPAEAITRKPATGPVSIGAPRPVFTDPTEGPDESALRYYAQLKQTARVNTEIKRLQRLYPSWRVPADLWDTSEPGGEDEDELWSLFSSDRLDELRSMITERMGVEPDWQPSRDLLNKLARKESRLKIMALWRNGEIDKLVDLVKSNPGAFEDTDVEVMWIVAEAMAKAKQNADALAIYETILKRDGKPEERLATIQKAMGTLRMMDVERLIAMGQQPDGHNEFDVILIDITRARISAFLHDERAEEIPQSDWDAFQTYARQDDDANQSGLCAWYLYKRTSYRDALEFFKISLEKGGDAMIAHGLSHSLRQLGMKREAEEVAYAWREPLINNSILFIDILETDLTKEIPPFIEPERLLRYGQVTMETASGEGAQALAWYAYNSCQFDVAMLWFQRAVAWHPKDATVYGYALTLRRLKKGKELVDLENRYDGLFQRVVGLVFPDGLYHPPTPCDMTVAQRQQGGDPNFIAAQQPNQPVYLAPPQVYPGQQPPGYPPQQQSPYMAQQLPINPAGRPVADPRQVAQSYVNDPNRQFAWGRVPQPQLSAYAPVPGQPVLPPGEQMPKLNPKEFPIPMYPENDLRFPASGQASIEAAQTIMGGPFTREPYPGPWPQVARRVPGIGPMPYERYGFTLLPGWNGITTATWPPASAQVAPAGTLWALEPPGEEAAIQQGRSPGVR